MMDHNTATQLVEALQKECNLYQQMLVLSSEQAKLMEEQQPDIDRIAALMDEKIQLSSEIESVEDEHRAIKLEWEQSYQTYPDEERLAVKHVRDQITDALETLQQLEQQTAAFLETAGKDVSAQLQNIYKSRSINRAYFNAEKHPPKYYNRFSK